MTKAVTVKELIVKCDKCTFRTKANLEKWHNKPCPECGAPDIISDADMVAYDALMVMVEWANMLAGDVKDGHSATVVIDSAALKGGL